MQYKSDYEFIPTNNCWEEGGEYYDGDKLIRTVLVHEDETQEPFYFDSSRDEWTYPFAVELDDDTYPGIDFGPAFGMMWGNQSRSVLMIGDYIPDKDDYERTTIGYVDFDASGDTDNAKAYWDLAELLLARYE